MEETSDPALEELLDYLKRSRGFDFTGYKRASLQRRITKRVHEVGVPDFGAYIDYLEVHPDEFTLLFNTVLINVTSFFRDPDSWEYLAEEILAPMLEEKPSGDPVRIWSAGCSSGEEAYSVSILLAEALGVSEFRRRVKIYATDIDDEALDNARRAVYSADDLKPISTERRNRFFEPAGDQFMFRSELRRSVIFGRHDLVKDPPMSKLDLIVCRNVLMYLNALTQGGVLARLHFALNPTGALFLGRAEMLLSHSDLFVPAELKHRVFSKVGSRRDRLVALAQAGNLVAEGQIVGELDLRAGAFDALGIGQFVVDVDGKLVLANRRARELFDLAESDVGRPLQDLELSYRPVELRSLIDRAYQEDQTVRVWDVSRQINGATQNFELEVSPLRRNGGTVLGASVSFSESTVQQQLQADLRAANSRIDEVSQAYHATTEELETTNEELQSTNEELETTNEELQSGNEELETMNEELQSTNEELRSMNEMLHEQSGLLDHSNAFLESVLAGITAACIVVDVNSMVRIWKEKAEDLWGLRKEEALNQPLGSLDIGLPVAQLKKDIAACVHGDSAGSIQRLSAINRRGKSIRCKVTTTPLRTLSGSINGVILLIEPIDEAEQ